MDIDGNKPRSQKYVAGNDQHCWEFVTPIVGFPAGWFQIQSIGCGHFLSHSYCFNTPILLPLPDSPRPSQYRESWEFQWALAHSSCFDSGSMPANSWRIINRLTNRHLSRRFTIKTPQSFSEGGDDLLWQLELDPSGNWTIRNRVTSYLLEQGSSSRGGGTAVTCDDRKFTQAGGGKSWRLVYVCNLATMLPSSLVIQVS